MAFDQWEVSTAFSGVGELGGIFHNPSQRTTPWTTCFESSNAPWFFGWWGVWVFPTIGGFPPKWMVKTMENPIRMDDLGGKPTIFGKQPYRGITLWVFIGKLCSNKNCIVDGCCSLIHPWKLTWNLKITQLKRKIIFQTSIFGFNMLIFKCVVVFSHDFW